MSFILDKISDPIYKDTGIYDEEREEEIRDAVSTWGEYAESGDTFDSTGKYLCGTCEMRSGEDKCFRVVSPISFDTGSCEIYTKGESVNASPMPVKLLQIQVGYTERPNVKGFGCIRCKYAAEAVKEDSDKRPSWCSFWGMHVLPNACCFANAGDDDVIAPVDGKEKNTKTMESAMELAKSVTSTEEVKQIFCPLVKVDVAKREVWGVVTADAVDKSGEICDYDTTVPYYKAMVDEMSKATDGANIFPLRVMHGLVAAGKGISIEFRKEAKEIYMGFKVVDDTEWKKVQENVYTGFSQGGRYIKKWADGEFTRYTASPGEVSLVDVPCLTRAHFDYVKADGSVEMRKFATTVTPALTPRPVTAEPEFKYLVESTKQFPYAKLDGKPVLKLMVKSWSAIEKYQGGGKEVVFKKLKKMFAQKGLDTPSEKKVEISKMLNSLLQDTIQNRAYGQLGKGMYTVSRFSCLIEEITYLWLMMEYEREQEGDESPVTDDMKEHVSNLLDSLLEYTEEQVLEEKERLVAR